MAIKPLEKKKSLSWGAGLKLGLLIFAVAGGVFLNTLHKNSVQYQTKSQVLGVNDLIPSPEVVKQQIQQVAKETVSSVSDTAQNVLDQTKKSVGNSVEKAAGDAGDSVFKNTVVAFIKNALEKLPSQQQEEVKKSICK